MLKYTFLIFLSLFMATLTQAQTLALIKKPKNGTLLRQAFEEERMLKALSTGEDKELVIDEFARLLVEERRPKFRETFGIHTAPIFNKVQTHLQRIFEAQGRFIEPKFSKTEQKDDFQNYLNSFCYYATEGKPNGMDAEAFFRTAGINALIFQPNTVAYLDIFEPSPAQRTFDPRPRPSIQTVEVSKILDLDATAKGIEYIIIYNVKYSGNDQGRIHQYFVIDDEKYSLYERQGNRDETRRVREAYHRLGTCPAVFLSDDNRYKNNYNIKESLAWQSIDDIKAWLLLKNFAKVYGWESGVPTKFEPKADCDGKHQSGVSCEGGKFYLIDGKVEACPKCMRRSQEKIAWGKVVEVPLEHLETPGAELLFKAFGYANNPVGVMQFHEDDLERKREQIEFDLIGKSKESAKTREARNEKDVQSDVEDMKRILASVSEIIEKKWVWLESLVAMAREYDGFTSHTVHLGRGYLLQNKLEHQAEYTALVQSGADDLVLTKKLQELVQTSYGYDSKFLELFDMLGAIIPFRHLSIEKVYNHSNTFLQNPQTRRDFFLRIYASNWIQEFLTLNDVQVWGQNISRQARFNALRRYFDKKLKKFLPENNAPTDALEIAPAEDGFAQNSETGETPASDETEAQNQTI